MPAAGDVEENPGVLLGVALGILAREGRDKLTIFTSPEIEAFGGWLEQLVAESTGKEGKGIVPVDREAPGGSYGNDRVFAYIGIGSSTRPFPISSGRGILSFASSSTPSMGSPRSSSVGRSRPRSRARSSG